MSTVTDTLKQLSLGYPGHFLNLTIFPLHRVSVYERNYQPLGDAIRARTARLCEVTQWGSVPELVLENRGKMPVLILEGEELIGAKQNRTANVTILAPAGKTIRIPVTCVESGRWRYESDSFEPSEQVHFLAGRSAKMASVGHSMKIGGPPRANQTDVWNDISDKALRMGVSSGTGAMKDVFDGHRTRLERYVDAFEAAPDQIGAVFAIGERIEGLELFDCPQTLEEMLPKLIRSYAIDAIESVLSHKENPTLEKAERFIEVLRETEIESYPSIGIGTEVRLRAPSLIAAGLVAEGRVVHLAAFAKVEETRRADASPGWFARLRNRRRGLG